MSIMAFMHSPERASASLVTRLKILPLLNWLRALGVSLRTLACT